MKKTPEKKQELSEDDKKFPLPIYSSDEDIFSQEKEVSFEEEKDNKLNEDLSGDLDVPGSELDDSEEVLGDEDEENNYYSIGGDDHNDLEEDKEEDR
jgi:hypothetical protein